MTGMSQPSLMQEQSSDYPFSRLGNGRYECGRIRLFHKVVLLPKVSEEEGGQHALCKVWHLD